MRGSLLVLAAVAAMALPGPAEAAAARRPPVVMIVFDEFPADSLRGADGRIDAGRFPNFARLARDSTWYPNATTVSDATQRAVPAILDGRWPRKRRWSARDHRSNIFRLLSRRGYDLDSTEEVTSLCRARGCRHMLDDKTFDEVVAAGRFERLLRTFRSIRATRRPRFTFHHSLLPHMSWDYLPSGRRHEADGDLDLTGPRSFSHPFLNQHAEQRYLLQLGAVDHALGKLIRRLRGTGLYDKALVVITADHGIAFEPGLADRRVVTKRVIDRIAPVPLIIKRPRQRRGRIHAAYVRTVDIVPTIAAILGIRIPWRVDGRPVSSRAVKRRRRVKLARREFAGNLTMTAQEFERRRAAQTAQRLRTFGWGSWSSIYRIGPHPELLGRVTSELAVTSPGAAAATIRAPGRYLAVNSATGFVPSAISGEIRGGSGERDLAVAVNSRIAAVGRSANVRGERFGVMVPESVLRSGRNEIEIFEVRSGPPGLSLVPLGRAP